MTGRRVAVVGIACCYPDADSPEQFWQNILAGRRAFRRLPDERLRLADYHADDPATPDRCYASKAAVIEGWTFDRVRYRVAGSTYRATDLTHWLALDTAAQALADAGFPDGEGLPAARTGVIVGNTLTGEFSRANLMRLRWPYVRRTVAAALCDQGWSGDRLDAFLDDLETRYKRPFPPVDEDTLAGGLANTIAGRICNHFDLGGGGYTVDGACASSLLAVAHACTAVSLGQLDMAVVGGVDLSLDPFELIGFAKTGALATGEMRVYDRDANGFWPGEGCGMLVLMADDQARAHGLRRYATIPGWGYSSDGAGGITRPTVDGHLRALRDAYDRAGFGIDTVAYLEGHGTGTAVGDTTELRALGAARRAADPAAPAVALGSVKANIGHTKAAAGVAGLVKAVLAVHHRVIPPATGCRTPHPELCGDHPSLRLPATAEPWPIDGPVRAGVSALGFGGINAHIVVQGTDHIRPAGATERLTRSRQDTEILLLDAADVTALRDRAGNLAALAARLCYAELGDLAATLHHELAGRPVRAAVVAGSPEQAAQGFERLRTLLDNRVPNRVDTECGVFLGGMDRRPRIGFLFPGQGSGVHADGGALRSRFAGVDRLYRECPPEAAGDGVDTAVAQPRIVTASAAVLRVLDDLGIVASAAAGHSLGELTALHWAGAMTEAELLRHAAARGRIMADASHGGGAMAGIAAPPETVTSLLDGEPVVIAGYNGPLQTVVSGSRVAVDRVCAHATERGLTSSRLPVSHAFHSGLVAPAATGWRDYLVEQRFSPLSGQVFSTVTGGPLAADVDLPELLAEQVLAPVLFSAAVRALAAETDLLLEVGPGRVLTGLAAQIAPSVPAVAVDAGGGTLAGLLSAVAAAYVLGAPVDTRVLFADRFTRPLPLDKQFRFFASPTESTPADEASPATSIMDIPVPEATGDSPLEVLRRLAARRAELPPAAVGPDTHLLDELHLSSMAAGQLMIEAARELGLAAPTVTSAYATATLGELARMIEQLATGPDGPPNQTPTGVGPWVHAFTVELIPVRPAPAPASSRPGRWRLFGSEALGIRLRDALDTAGLGGGVLLCLPGHADERMVPLMADAVRAAVTGPPARFAVVGGRPGAASLAKTLYLERPDIHTTVLTLPDPPGEPSITGLVAEIAATTGFRESDCRALGVPRAPVLRPYAPAASGELPLGPADVLLVTGGGKGITAECALALARESGTAVGLLGRADPATDLELAANLDRLLAAGVRHKYLRADVTDLEQVRVAVAGLRKEFGPVTAVLHGAGHNDPRTISELDEAALRAALAPKVGGLRAVLAATDPAALRLLVSFGSIIGRSGLRGEAAYGLANDWLTELTRQVGEERPYCRCVALEWSVWSGAGMGERLGVLEALAREGVTAIPVAEGVAMVRRILSDPHTPDRLVVTGRADGLPTLGFDRPELPLLRFLDRPRVHYPGVELITEVDLSAGTDPYLADHRLAGDPLFPAVFGMEAMVQVASALVGASGPAVLTNLEFPRPIGVPAGGTTVRVAALTDDSGAVRTVLRSSETGFQADHFRGTVRFSRPEPAADVPGRPVRPMLPVDPTRELYGPILFQGKLFQRLIGYRELAARRCVAEIANLPAGPWFGSFLPAGLVLGDPGTRDAVMHAIQACVPDVTLLPVAVDRLEPAEPGQDWDTVTTTATERSADDDTYVYDVEVREPAGLLIERWCGLRLRAVRRLDGGGPWVPVLLGPYLERRAGALLAVPPRCVVLPDAGGPADRRGRTRRAVAWVRDVEPHYRPDGRPELPGASMSAAHGAGLTFVVVAPDDTAVGCDIEVVADADWAGLLGPERVELARLLARERNEKFPVAATRVWTAVECLRKCGSDAGALTAEPAGPDRWVVLRCGVARIATVVTTVQGVDQPVVFAMSAEG